MMTQEAIVIGVFTVGGLTFTFTGFFFELFIVLWLMYGFLIIPDIFTRTRIEKLKKMPNFKIINRTNVRSYRMIDGFITKVIYMLVMAGLALVGYHAAGVFSHLSWVVMSVSSMLVGFMGLLVTNEMKSIIENSCEFSEMTGSKPNGAILLLAKTLGIINNKIESRINKELNPKFKNDDES